MKKKCKVEGCDRPHNAKGYCNMHYARMQRTGNVGAADKLINVTAHWQAQCSIDGCNKQYYCKNYCEMHYIRLKKWGDVNKTLICYGRTECTVDGCTRPHQSKGYCGLHYNRLWNGNDVGKCEPMIAPRGTGSITNQGYHRIKTKDGKNLLTHRLLVEQKLNRPLTKNENIHHRNGDKLDNSIGDCLLSNECNCTDGLHNLELRDTSPIPGRNIKDMVKYATNILKQYAPEKLR